MCIVSTAESTSFSACSLCVRAGSFFEPDRIPGLSHYVEHLLFQGSHKYPNPYGLLDELTRVGGCCNATTDAEHVSYYMQLPTDRIREFLDQFAHMFIDPIINSKGLDFERKRVDEEFGSVLSSDQLRAEQVLATTASRKHPAGKFTWGNWKSIPIGSDSESAVVKFIDKFYTADRMTLAVHSSESIDDITTMAIEAFSGLRSKRKNTDISFSKTAFDSKRFQRMFTILPEDENLNAVHLNWLVPSVYPHYKSRPLEFVGRLLDLQYLYALRRDFIDRGWSAVNVWAGVGPQQFRSNTWYAIFTVQLKYLDTTTDEKLPDIVRRVFDYLATIRATVAQSPYVYREVMADMDSYPIHLVPPLNAVIRIAKHMQYYRPRDYLEQFGQVLPDFKTITRYIDHMKADRVSVTVQSRRMAERIHLDVTEPWFNTRYRVDDIPKQWLKSWKQAARDDSFFY
ncbi:nardilysin-like [Adelges cooleyi]|uniref:nardilysin-like n=1 Tax=Adelges cooleyi TaxID=133065 RepID=UPI0021803E4D|nr:nardilysin-like [Adelges cooleyi]